MLYVYQYQIFISLAAPLLKRLTTQRTDRQYSYYAKSVKEFLSREIFCFGHNTFIGIQVSPVFQNTHLEKLIQHINWQALQNLDICIALGHCNHKLFFLFSTMYPHFCLSYSNVDKTQA